MANVQGVNGPIDADDLGLTLIHEHFFSSDEAVTAQWPHARERETEHRLAIESAEAVMGHGVRTVVEPTAMLLGRDLPASIQLATETGLQIVACTGVYTYDYLPHFLQNRSEDFIADLYVHDIEQGIQGTEAKAAFVKCAADEPGITANVEKLHRAAARASVRTGVPVMAHSRPASDTGPRQVEILLEEGVPPERIQIAHTGDSDDLGYIEGLLEKGVYIGMDRYGLNIYPADRAAKCHRPGAAGAWLRRPDVHLAGLRHPDRQRARLDPAGGDRADERHPPRRRLEHDPAVRGDHPGAEGGWRDRRPVRDDRWSRTRSAG